MVKILLTYKTAFPTLSPTKMKFLSKNISKEEITVPRVEFILYKGVRILDLDVRDSRDVDQNIEAFRLAEELAMKEPLKSLRLLTDVTNALYTVEEESVLNEFSKSTTPYMKASAVVGVTDFKWTKVKTLIKLTGRDIKLFDTRENAQEWLSGQ
jgi:hypothetical protein